MVQIGKEIKIYSGHTNNPIDTGIIVGETKTMIKVNRKGYASNVTRYSKVTSEFYPTEICGGAGKWLNDYIKMRECI